MSRDPSLSLPFIISHDKIADIAVDYNDKPRWTSAMRCLLIDLKWAICWCSKQLKNK